MHIHAKRITSPRVLLTQMLEAHEAAILREFIAKVHQLPPEQLQELLPNVVPEQFKEITGEIYESLRVLTQTSAPEYRTAYGCATSYCSPV